MSSLGPITTTLEEELKEKLRQRNLVIWLDKDGIYTPYVDELVQRHAQGSFFAPVVPFRGSYLEMLMALELEIRLSEELCAEVSRQVSPNKMKHQVEEKTDQAAVLAASFLLVNPFLTVG